MKFLPHVSIRQERFGAVIFDKKREKFFVVDDVGNDVLMALQKSENIDEVVAQLSEKYDQSPQVIKEDVLSFVEELRTAGLIE